MASWVLAKCCYLRKGGMITKGLKNTIDAITANPTEHIFPDPPLRKMRPTSPQTTTAVFVMLANVNTKSPQQFLLQPPHMELCG